MRRVCAEASRIRDLSDGISVSPGESWNQPPANTEGQVHIVKRSHSPADSLITSHSYFFPLKFCSLGKFRSYDTLSSTVGTVIYISSSFSCLLADDQASRQAAGLRARGRAGRARTRLLPEDRLGETGEQGDPASLQAQSGESGASLFLSCVSPNPGGAPPTRFPGEMQLATPGLCKVEKVARDLPCPRSEI